MLLSEFVNVDTGKTVFLFLACMKLNDVNDLYFIYNHFKNRII